MNEVAQGTERRSVIKWMVASAVGSLALTKLEATQSLLSTSTAMLVDELMLTFRSKENFLLTLKDFGKTVQKSYLPGTNLNGTDVTSADFALELQQAIDQVSNELCTQLMTRLRNYYGHHYTNSELQQMVSFFKSPVGQKAVNELTSIDSEVWKITKSFSMKLNELVHSQIPQKADVATILS